MAAWRTVLKLAPNHEYAGGMVTALQGRTTDADVRIRLAGTMVHDGLLPAARAELQTLRNRSSLTDGQRQQTLLLLAEVELYSGKGEPALAMINEVISRNPEVADTLPVRLLTAQTQLVIGGELTATGLAGLTKIVELSAELPAGEIAALDLLRVAELFHDHPKIGTIPDMLWAISTELATRNYHDEAITLWNQLTEHDPQARMSPHGCPMNGCEVGQLRSLGPFFRGDSNY